MSLLVVGLLMSVVGVILTSSRDLTMLGRAVWSVIVSGASAVRAWLRRTWIHLRGSSEDGHGQAVSGAAGVAVGASGTAFAWNPAPDGMDLPAAIARFRDRTDNLFDMIKFEGNRRSEETRQLSRRIEDLSSAVASRTDQLEARIDEFDIKPAGQRAAGALLTICGTLLMFAGGLMGTS